VKSEFETGTVRAFRIAPLNGVAEQIELTAVYRKDEAAKMAARVDFLDLHTLAFALTDNSYSLASAIKAFGLLSRRKWEHQTNRACHGGRNNLCASGRARDAWAAKCSKAKSTACIPLPFPPDKAYSPALDRKVLSARDGVSSRPMRKFKDIPPKIHGIAMGGVLRRGGRNAASVRWPVGPSCRLT